MSTVKEELTRLIQGQPEDSSREEIIRELAAVGDPDALREERVGAAVRAMAGGRPPVLDVVPLFESAADLANAPDVLTGMLALPDHAASQG